MLLRFFLDAYRQGPACPSKKTPLAAESGLAKWASRMFPNRRIQERPDLLQFCVQEMGFNRQSLNCTA